MEIFSFNLITIGLVILILAVYRYLDKNNRSLEKVKKFTDKELERLASVIDTKTQEIQNLAIELQVNLKTGKEILKRISDSESELETRAGNFEMLKSKIHEYDVLIEELNKATKTVDDNIKQIHTESGFVDKIAKTIKSSQSKLDEIGSAIPALREEMNKKLEENVEIEKQRIFEEIKSAMLSTRQDTAQFEKRLKDYAAFMTKLESRRVAMEGETTKLFERQLSGFETKLKEKRETSSAEFHSYLDGIIGNGKNQAAEVRETMKASLSQYKKSMEEIESGYGKKLDGLRQSSNLLEQNALADINSYITKNSDEIKKKFEEKLSTVTVYLENRQDAVKTELDTIIRYESAMDGKAQGIKKDFDNSISNMFAAIDDFKIRFDDELQAASGEIESTVLKKIAGTLGDYENDCNYRLKKLEDSHFDIEKFEVNLKELMEIKKADTQQYFESFIIGLEKSAALKKQDHEKIISEMSANLKSLDHEIKDIKSKAYHNVSEKMKLLEDEFFSDLKSRSEKIELSLNTWERDFDSNLERKYNALDKKFDDRMSLSETEWEKRIDVKLGSVSDKFNALENQFELYQSKLRSELDEMGKKQSEVISKNVLLEKLGGYMVRLEKEFGHIKKEMEELIVRQQSFKEFETQSREIHSRSIEYAKKVESIYNDSNAKLDSLKSDVEKEKSKVTELTGSIDQHIKGFNESFTTKLDAYSGGLNRKASAIEKQLNGIDERIARFSSSIDEQAISAIDKFKSEVSAMEGDFAGKSKKFRDDIDSKIEGFSKTLKDDQERLKNMQDRIFGRIESDYKTLLANLNEIEKQQKNFESQTMLFERADKLKLELKGDIEELKKELQIIEPEKKKLNAIESEFTKTQKITAEVSAKLARFFAEKSKIDDMDKNMRQLMKVSESVEKRLESVTGNHDALQEIELKLKSLFELEQKTETQYDRLEKKNQMIETTVKEVEKNFKLLDDLEKHVKRIDESVQAIPNKITTINDNIKYLAENKEKADAAIEKMDKMDELFTDIEERTNKLQVAREWLSRTETRLETISKNANDQLNLLKALIKDDGGQDPKKGGKGAPSFDTRQMIIKLARQGWSVKEIAKASSVSQGEVELVLELEPQKR